VKSPVRSEILFENQSCRLAEPVPIRRVVPHARVIRFDLYPADVAAGNSTETSRFSAAGVPPGVVSTREVGVAAWPRVG